MPFATQKATPTAMPPRPGADSNADTKTDTRGGAYANLGGQRFMSAAKMIEEAEMKERRKEGNVLRKFRPKKRHKRTS